MLFDCVECVISPVIRETLSLNNSVCGLLIKNDAQKDAMTGLINKQRPVLLYHSIHKQLKFLSLSLFYTTEIKNNLNQVDVFTFQPRVDYFPIFTVISLYIHPFSVVIITHFFLSYRNDKSYIFVFITYLYCSSYKQAFLPSLSFSLSKLKTQTLLTHKHKKKLKAQNQDVNIMLENFKLPLSVIEHWRWNEIYVSS